MKDVKVGITVCPFKTVTSYLKRSVNGGNIPCAAKDASIVEHGFGKCDRSCCPYWNSGNATCNKTQK